MVEEVRAFNRGLTDDSKGIGYPSIGLTRHDVTAAHYEWIPATHVVTLIDGLIHDEPTWRCHQNPFIGAPFGHYVSCRHLASC